MKSVKKGVGYDFIATEELIRKVAKSLGKFCLTISAKILLDFEDHTSKVNKKCYALRSPETVIIVAYSLNCNFVWYPITYFKYVILDMYIYGV